MNLSTTKPGDFFTGTVKITRKAKPGPVVFIVTDGTKSVDAVTRDSPFEVNDVVELRGMVSERSGKLQIDIQRMDKSDKSFDSMIEEQSKPVRTQFSLKSDRFEKMKPMFLKVAQRLRKAIIEGQAILIRHHNDTDGISAGLNIEIACKQVMDTMGIDSEHYLYRNVCKAPFYEIGDAFRDISSGNRLKSFGQKQPLIFVVDNGSTPEDLSVHKVMHSMGYEIIVVDHHNPVILHNGKTGVDDYVQVHLNPYIVGLDGKTCCGMICYELGRMISEVFANEKNALENILPAISGISDRCDIPETEEYIKRTGQTREELTKIGIAIDYTSYNLKFDSGDGIYEELLKNKKFVDTLVAEVKEGMDTQLQSTLPYVRTHEINNVTFSHIDLEKYTTRFEYPTPGKVLGAIHDKIAEQHAGRAVLTIGYVSDMIIVRATQPVLPVAKIVSELQKKFPDANVDGGGHECAGTVKFVSAHLVEIVEYVKQLVKDLKAE